MAKTFTAPFIQNQRIATAVASAAVGTLSDTPSNTVLLCTAGTDDSIITNLSVMPRGTVTATSLLLFWSGDSGTTKRLIDSELMTAYTQSNTTANPETIFARYTELTPLRLGKGEQLYIGIQVASSAGTVFKAEIGDF